ncbi:stromelysin-1-like [Mantella aurantiaca]
MIKLILLLLLFGEGFSARHSKSLQGSSFNSIESDGSGETDEPEKPSVCPPGPSFGAVATLAGETLFFKDNDLWRQISLDIPPEHYPTNYLWSKLPNDIEAAYEYNDDEHYRIFIFKGTKYWVTEDFDVRSDSPKDISHLGFPHSVKNIDAAVHDETSGKTYFFVGDKYWSYDEEKKRMDANSPKRIASDFPGIGVPIQSAFQKNGDLYFFDNENLYQFDNTQKRVVDVSKKNKWLKC